jgi:hypothetical protein
MAWPRPVSAGATGANRGPPGPWVATDDRHASPHRGDGELHLMTTGGGAWRHLPWLGPLPRGG